MDQVNEMAWFLTPSVKKIHNEIPKVTKKEFIEQIQPADIVVAFTEKKLIEKYLTVKLSAKFMATLQGSPYTTSKFILDKNTIAGYGVSPRDTMTGSKVGTMPIPKYMRWRAECALIRVKGLTESQRDKAVNYVRSRVGLSYGNSDLYKSVWDRFTKRKLVSFFGDKKLDVKSTNAIQQPLFCSTLVSTAFLAAGIKKQFNGKHHYDVWPVDFLMADITEKVCKFDYS